MHWYIKVLKNYANFSGRARRKEYWFFVLFNTIISFVLGFTEGLIAGMSGTVGPDYIPIVSSLYILAVLIPSIAVGVRRLHDIGKSGWWLFIGLVPVIGGIVLLVFFFMEGDSGPNQYGADPKANAAVI
ncbi:MAG: DUF805 domain-containing protein [Balneolaceae bacterium]|nr:DUF805 domain-containing protein [Balneolaceae bacterium]